MDLKQAKYILKIAEEKNITHAADKLYITQSALNQQLLKLEKELGTELFTRSRTDWRPTEAGIIYLEAAKEVLRIKKDAYHQIYDLANQQKGTLSIGFTPNRGSAMFSDVYPLFHARHPQIEVEPMELSVSRQLELIRNHTLDIGFLTLLPNQYKTSLSYTQIRSEEIYLAVPSDKDMSDFLKKEKASSPVLSLKHLRNEAFVLMYKQSSIRLLVDQLFQEADYKPEVLFETSSTNTILNMIEAGLCCGLIPEYYVKPNHPKISYYSLPSHPVWDIVACCNKTSYKSKAANDLIALVTEYWNS